MRFRIFLQEQLGLTRLNLGEQVLLRRCPQLVTWHRTLPCSCVTLVDLVPDVTGGFAGPSVLCTLHLSPFMIIVGSAVFILLRVHLRQHLQIHLLLNHELLGGFLLSVSIAGLAELLRARSLKWHLTLHAA